MGGSISYFDSLQYIFPELALTLGLCLLLVWEMVLGPKKNGEKASLALGFLGVTAWLLAQRLSWSPQTVFGMLRVDAFATIFKLFITATTAVVIWMDTQDRSHNQEGKAETWFLLLTAALGGFVLVGTRHLLMLYLGLETLGIASYALAGIHKRDRFGAEAAVKYVVYGALASGVMLFGISLLYGMTGTLDAGQMVRTVLELSVHGQMAALSLPTILLLVGFGFKLSIFPFQWWAPDVYQGVSAPVAAFLAVGSKGVALAAFLRVLATLYAGILIGEGSTVQSAQGFASSLIPLLGILSGATMVFGNLAALCQTNLKRLLAYSSIGHAGYMLLGLTLMGRLGFEVTIVYVFVYWFMTLGAFAGVLYFVNQSGSEEISGLKGLGFKHPVAGVSMVVFMAALTGLPPTAGFSAKWYLMAAAWDGGLWFLTLLLALMSVVSLFYYFRIAKALYLEKPETERAVVSTPSLSALLFLLAVGSIAFINFEPLAAVARESVLHLLYW
jgi:NADH-quinone oxidoreductase subunit N